MAPGGSTNRAPVDESSSKNALDAGNQSRLDEFLRHVMAPAIVRALLDPSNQADEGSAKPIGSRKGAP